MVSSWIWGCLHSWGRESYQPFLPPLVSSYKEGIIEEEEKGKRIMPKLSRKLKRTSVSNGEFFFQDRCGFPHVQVLLQHLCEWSHFLRGLDCASSTCAPSPIPSFIHPPHKDSVIPSGFGGVTPTHHQNLWPHDAFFHHPTPTHPLGTGSFRKRS